MKLIKIPFSLQRDGAELAPSEIIKFLNTKSYEISEVKEKIYENLKNKDHFIAVGGDHSITLPVLKAFSESHSKPGLVMLDAHPDCDRFLNLANQKDLLIELVNNNIIKKENIIVVGVRKVKQNEAEFLKNNAIRLFDMKTIFDIGIKEACDLIMENARRCDNLYITIDMDVVDPAFAPGVSNSEPGGLSSVELLYLVGRLRLLKNLRAADIVEVNPPKDINSMTVKLAAHVVQSF